MKPTTLAAVLTMLAVTTACSSLLENKGPYARATKGAATQIDAGMDDSPEVSPFPQQSPFGN